MSVDSLIKRSVLYDQYGNPLSTEPHGGKYPLEVTNTENNKLLEDIKLQLEDLKTIGSGIYNPAWVRAGGVNVVGNDTISRAYITPEQVGGSIGVYPRSAINAQGWYILGQSTSLTANMVTNTPVISFRNAGPKIIGITKFTCMAVVTQGFTGAQAIGVAVYIARNWTVSDSNGAALTPLLTSNKKRGSYPNSTVADFRVTFTTITAGTRTLDVNPIANIFGWATTTAGILWNQLSLYDHDAMSGTPLLLGTNEGFVVNTNGAMPATGAVSLAFGLDWFETDNW